MTQPISRPEAPVFAPGQVWTYPTRPGEETSRVVVCRVEEDPKLGGIVHIAVSGLRVKNRHVRTGVTDRISHMPYGADALRACVTVLEVSNAPLPPFEEGYRQWRAAFDAGQAGVWGLAVADAITAMETAMNQ